MPRVGTANGGGIYIVEGNMTALKDVGQAPAAAPQPQFAPKEPAPSPSEAALIRLHNRHNQKALVGAAGRAHA